MRKQLLTGVGAACLLLGLLLALTSPTVAQSVTRFAQVNLINLVASNDVTVGDDLTVTDLATVADLAVSEQLTVTAGLSSDDLAASDDVTVGDDLTIAGYVRYSPPTTITVVYQGVITPTGSLLYVTASAARGTRSILTTTASLGAVIHVVNVGAQTITLTDTAPLVMEGNFAMGAKDTITFYHDGDEWIELARVNN